VLITAREAIGSRLDFLIKDLLSLGCIYFVCVGRYSEDLHDLVDDIVLAGSLYDNEKSFEGVVTTWHETDSNDDVAAFFIEATCLAGGLYIAILDGNNFEDNMLRRSILKAADAKGVERPGDLGSD